jgi:hypothetical protein
MEHDLPSEIGRLEGESFGRPTPLLAFVAVAPLTTPEAYASRLKQLVHEALKVVQHADFEQDEIRWGRLPHWFTGLSGGGGDDVEPDPLGEQGKARYVRNRGDEPWDAEEWIYAFDPELRAWSWWDLTVDERGIVNVWVDTKGEAHVPCGELWWALYLAGAENAGPFTLERSGVWEAQRTNPM